MADTSTLRSLGGWLASMTGYPKVVQTAINNVPVSDVLNISEDASIERGARLAGNIFVAQNAVVESRCSIRGRIHIGESTKIETDSRLVGDISIADQVSVGMNSHIRGSVSVGRGTNFVSNTEIVGDDIEIGRYNAIANDVSYINRNHLMTKPSSQVRFYKDKFGNALEMPSRGPLEVGHDVWAGTKSVFLTGVSVGHGAVVGAGAVVTDDVEPYEIVGGTPAEHIGWRFDERTRNQLMDIEWWNWSEERMAEEKAFFKTDLEDVSSVRGLLRGSKTD